MRLDPDKERKKLRSRENSKGDKDKSVDSSKEKLERKNSGPNNNAITNTNTEELKRSTSGSIPDTRIRQQASTSTVNTNLQTDTVSILYQCDA